MIVRPRTATFRYRVGHLAHVYESASSSRPVGHLYNVREFKSLESAQRYGAQLHARGDNALLQVGVLQWMTPEAASEMLTELIASDVEIDGN